MRIFVWTIATNGILLISFALPLRSEAADFPNWMGASGSRASDSGRRLVTSVKDARVAWASEETLPTVYTDPQNKSDFFSSHISGTQRLANGNTLICSGEQGRFFEVDSGGKIVWEYVNPYEGQGPRGMGPPRGFSPRQRPGMRPGGSPEEPQGEEEGRVPRRRRGERFGGFGRRGGGAWRENGDAESQ